MFGLDKNQKVCNRFEFPANNLVITSIDIQSVEPVDQWTHDALQKSVQLAIEITANFQEASARYVGFNLYVVEQLNNGPAYFIAIQYNVQKTLYSICLPSQRASMFGNKQHTA